MNISKLLNYSLAIATLGAAPSIGRASEVELHFRSNQNGNGETAVNMTSMGDMLNMEVEYPIYKEWGNGSTTGDVWGGGQLGTLEFKNVAVLDFHGKDGTYACMNGNGSGMGIMSDSGGDAWEVDGKESFTVKANRSFEFKGFKLRKGSRLGEVCQIAVSSPAWGRLTQVDASHDLGFGVNFFIKGGVGTFVFSNSITVYDKQAILGDFAEDVSLIVEGGAPLTFDNHLDGEDGFALTSMMVQSDGILSGEKAAMISIGGLKVQLTSYK